MNHNSCTHRFQLIQLNWLNWRSTLWIQGDIFIWFTHTMELVPSFLIRFWLTDIIYIYMYIDLDVFFSLYCIHNSPCRLLIHEFIGFISKLRVQGLPGYPPSWMGHLLTFQKDHEINLQETNISPEKNDGYLAIPLVTFLGWLSDPLKG